MGVCYPESNASRSGHVGSHGHQHQQPRTGLSSGAAGTHSIPLIPHLIKPVNQFKLATNKCTGAELKTTTSKQRGQPCRSQRGRLLPPPAAHVGQRPGDPPASFQRPMWTERHRCSQGSSTSPSPPAPQGFGEGTAGPAPGSRGHCRYPCPLPVPQQEGWHSPASAFPRKGMWGRTHAGEGCVTAEEIQSGARGGCGSGARRKGRECVRVAAIPARGEEGCGRSRVAPPHTGMARPARRYRGGAAPRACSASGRTRPVSPGSARSAPCKQPGGLCAVQTRRGHHKQLAGAGGLCRRPLDLGRSQPQRQPGRVQVPPLPKSLLESV